MLKNNSHNKGFTVMELMIAIFIIVLITGFVLSSLSTARVKSQNNAIEITLAELPSKAQRLFDKTGSFGASYHATDPRYPRICPSVNNSTVANNNTSLFYSAEIKKIIQSAAEKSGGVVSGSGVNSLVKRTVCKSDSISSTWVVAVTSRSGDGAYCVDSKTNTVKFLKVSIPNPDTPTQALSGTACK